MKRVVLLRDFSWFLIPIVLAAGLVFIHFFIFFQTWTAKGIKLLKKKKPQSAEKVFVKILERNPFHPYAHLNLGLTYDINNRPMKALKEYGMISKHFTQDSLQFFASFNTAELHSRLKNVDKALESYQQALAFSIEPDKIKQNIELLFKDLSDQKGNQEKTQKQKGKQSKGDSGDGQKNSQNQEADQKGESAQSKQDSDSSDGNEGGEKVSEKENDSDPSKKEREEEGEGNDSDDDSQNSQRSQNSRPHSEQGQFGSPALEGEISKNQAQSIMDEIEEQESNVRARQFKENSFRRPRRHTNKDW